MKLRDNLNTQDGYQEIIEDAEHTILEDKQRIEELLDDEEIGVSKYPKPNKDIIKSIDADFSDKYFELFLASYSIGKRIDEIESHFNNFKNKLIDYWQSESGYVQILNALSIAIMLEIKDDEFDRLVALVERDKVKDYLIDFLIRYKKPNWQQTETFIWKKPYKTIEDVVQSSSISNKEAIAKLQKYLSKWYNSLEIKTHESKWNIHTGYWSWEAGAIAKILELDDSSLKGQPYYPYDMVHFKEES